MQGVLDYEKASVYQMVIVASDGGRDSLSAECIVVVRVLDVNDNAPTITIRTLTSDVIGHLSRTPVARVRTVIMQKCKMRLLIVRSNPLTPTVAIWVQL